MDETKSILINNGLCDLQIRMTEDGHFLCRNMNFPDHETNYDDQMTVPALLDIIDYLKEASPIEYTKNFKNRWEEIETITKMNLSLYRK